MKTCNEKRTLNQENYASPRRTVIENEIEELKIETRSFGHTEEVMFR